MNPDRRRAMLGAMTAMAGGAFVALVFTHHIYAPGARQLQQRIASYDDFQNPILNSYAFGHAIYVGLRKLYGAIAFAFIGFLISMVFARPERILRTTLLIAIVRTGLEVVERLAHRGDTLLESSLDIAMGTIAGAIGAYAYNALARRANWEPQA